MTSVAHEIEFKDLHDQMNKLNGYTGYKGHNDNDNKIWADLDPALQGDSYCAAGDCYIWKHAGHPYVKIDHPWGFSYCPDAVRWAKENPGYWETDVKNFEPGDTILYCWDSTGVAEHTGTIVKVSGLDQHTFECNTSSGVAGNQSNGGGCYFRVRVHDSMTLGVLKSSKWLTDNVRPPQTPPKKGSPVKNPFDYDSHGLPLHVGVSNTVGSHGTDVKWAQWALAFTGDKIDGEFGASTFKATKLFQKAHGLRQDGVVGSATAAALSHITR